MDNNINWLLLFSNAHRQQQQTLIVTSAHFIDHFQFSPSALCKAQKSDVSKNHICKYYRHTATRKWVEDERQMLLSTWKIDKLQPLCYYHFIGNHITTAFMKGDNIEGMIESKLFNFVHFWLLCKPSYSYLDVYTNSLAE